MFDAACIEPIGQEYKVPPAIIRSVMMVESSGRNVISGSNRNGTRDYGVMQINSWWLPILRKHEIEQKDLMNVCTNIAVGAWLLQYSFSKTGEWKEALAAYHAGYGKRHKPYAVKYATKVLNQKWLGGHFGGSAKN